MEKIQPVPTSASLVVAYHRREGALDQGGRRRIPAAPGRQRIGMDLAGLRHQPQGNVGQTPATERQALLEPAVLGVEACSCPQRQGRVDCPIDEGSRLLGFRVVANMAKGPSSALAHRDRVGDALGRDGDDVGGKRIAVARRFQQAGHGRKHEDLVVQIAAQRADQGIGAVALRPQRLVVDLEQQRSAASTSAPSRRRR